MEKIAMRNTNEDQWRCPTCKRFVKVGAVYCKNCGQSLSFSTQSLAISPNKYLDIHEKFMNTGQTKGLTLTEVLMTCFPEFNLFRIVNFSKYPRFLEKLNEFASMRGMTTSEALIGLAAKGYRDMLDVTKDLENL